MNVHLSNAVRMFYSKSSFEMVYMEAIANALDAGATEICIYIVANSKDIAQSLQLTISDNGVGFTEDRFKKFSNLFDTEDAAHKGLGRLAYRFYFDKVRVRSWYGDFQYREFDFSDDFNGKSKQQTVSKDSFSSGTELYLTEYIKAKLFTNSMIDVVFLKKKILAHFYLRLFQLKEGEKNIVINIRSKIDGKDRDSVISTDDIPDFKTMPIKDEDIGAWFTDMTLYYYVQKSDTPKPSNVVTAINVEGRTYSQNFITKEFFHSGYDMVFLLISKNFNGMAEPNRENIVLSESNKQLFRNIFIRYISRIMNEMFPNIAEAQTKKKNALTEKYPHLSSYIDADSVGYMQQSEVLSKAEDKFFHDQKEILNTEDLNSEQYEKAKNISAISLTQYVLFRQRVIDKLKSLDAYNREEEIHNLLCPRYMVLDGTNAYNDLYKQNLWLIDDKFMTYRNALSEKEMTDLFKILDPEAEVICSGRPDIAIVFSASPDISEKFDIIIIELKREGIDIDKAIGVERQLKDRARELYKHFGNKIQRMWFYGIIDITDEVELNLDGYRPLYSTGKLLFSQKDVKVSLNPELTISVGVYLLDYKALIGDAEKRNATFLSLIQNTFRESGQEQQIVEGA